METTFSWKMLSVGGGGGGTCGDAPAFVTANGKAVGYNKKSAAVPCASAFDGNIGDDACNNDNGGNGVSAAVPSQTHDEPLHAAINATGLCTPGPTGVNIEAAGSTNGRCGGRVREGDGTRSRSMSVPVVTPYTMSAPPPCHPPSAGSNPGVVSRAIGEGGNTDTGAASPEFQVAKAAAQASLSVIRKSIIRRRGGMPIRPTPPPPARQDATGAAAAGGETWPLVDARLCATPFVIRRPPSSSSSSKPRPASKSGAGAKGGPLDLSRAGDEGSGERDVGGGEAPTERKPGRAPDTPAAVGTGNLAAQLVTPVTGGMAGDGGVVTGAVGLKRNRASSAGKGLRGKGPKRGKSSKAAADGMATAGAGEKDGYPGADGSGKQSEETSVHGAATAAAAAAAVEVAAASETAPAVAPPCAPTKIVVTFSAAGSLGMGVAQDDTEEGSVVLAGKAPTSAAASVPNGWRLTEVNGKSARRLGGVCVGVCVGG